MDVDEWMRAVAFLSLIGSDDMYTYGNSHNLIIYFRPQDQKGMAFLWDMDYEFVAATTKAFPGNGSATTYKIITTFPDNYRRYYNHLLDLSSVTGDATYMGQWAGRYAGLLGQNWGNAVNYLSQRAAYVRGSMPLTTPFAIANNAGNNFATSTNPVTLAGTAPLTVRDILVNGLPGMITWISLTNWTLNVPLPAYTNLLTLQGLDNHGRALSNAADTILITNLGVPPLRAVVINEWMADNAGPGGVPDPVNGRYSDWFELYNPNNIAVNLGGYYLTDLLSTPNLWAIPTNTMIAAHGFLLIWADNLTNLNAPGDLHANFQLSKKGDLIALYAPEGTLQHEVTFGAQFQNVSQGFFPDGNSNGFYFMTNWTPRSANQLGAPPAPSFATMTLQPDGSVSMTATTLPGRTYQLQYKNDLYAYAWTPLAPNHQADGGSLILTDAPQPQWQRFYRLILLP